MFALWTYFWGICSCWFEYVESRIRTKKWLISSKKGQDSNTTSSLLIIHYVPYSFFYLRMEQEITIKRRERMIELKAMKVPPLRTMARSNQRGWPLRARGFWNGSVSVLSRMSASVDDGSPRARKSWFSGYRRTIRKLQTLSMAREALHNIICLTLKTAPNE